MREVNKVNGLSLVGAWCRSLLVYPDGRYDDTTDVTWLQGPSLFGDLRLPRPSVQSSAACLRDLDLETIELLARQEGFAGVLIEHEDHFEWKRLIDYQPPTEHADRGRLRREGDVLVELGFDIDYREHWHYQAGIPTPVKGMLIQDGETDRQAIFLQIGQLFLLARDRMVRLPPGGSLVDRVRAGTSLKAMQDLVDCEISIGSVKNGWQIAASSLPWRRGASIAPQREDRELVLHDVEPNGQAVRRRWSIVREEDRSC